MKIIKRSGAEAVFDISKIIIAINKANHEVVEAERLTADQIKEIAQYIEDSCKDANHALNVEDIQDLVEDQLMDKRAFSVARKYREKGFCHETTSCLHYGSLEQQPV